MSNSHKPTVANYMTRCPYTIDRHESIDKAAKVMDRHDIRHLPVLAEGKVVGLVSARDVRLIKSLRGVDPAVVRVEDAMATDPYTVSPDEPLDRVAATMAKRKIGSALAIENGEIVGVFTTTDALIALLYAWQHVHN